MSQRPKIHRLQQLDLFRPRPLLPTWRSLPSEVRQQTLSLMARLLRAARQAGGTADRSREVNDE